MSTIYLFQLESADLPAGDGEPPHLPRLAVQPELPDLSRPQLPATALAPPRPIIHDVRKGKARERGNCPPPPPVLLIVLLLWFLPRDRGKLVPSPNWTMRMCSLHEMFFFVFDCMPVFHICGEFFFFYISPK